MLQIGEYQPYGDQEHKKWSSQFEEDMQYLKQGGYKQEQQKEEHKEYDAREPR